MIIYGYVIQVIMLKDILKSEWESYNKVLKSGLYNMNTAEAIRATGLNQQTYVAIVKNYDALKTKFGKE